MVFRWTGTEITAVAKTFSEVCSGFIGGAVVIVAISGYGYFLRYCGLTAIQLVRGKKRRAPNAQKPLWPKHRRFRIGYAFAYLGGSLALTVGVASFALRNAQIAYLRNCDPKLVALGAGCAIIGTRLICKHAPPDPYLQHALWALHCGVTGSALALLPSSGVPVLVKAGLYTAVIVLGWATTATVNAYYSSEKIYLHWIRNRNMALGIVLGSALVFRFVALKGLMKIIIGSIVFNGSLAVFPCFILHDTQKMITGVETTRKLAPLELVNAQMDLFSDAFWILVWCTAIIGKFKGIIFFLNMI